MLRKLIFLSKRKTIVGLLLSLLSGVGLVLLFAPFNLYSVVWVSLIPLFFAIDGGTLKKTAVRGYFCGVVFFLGLVYWLVYVTFFGTVLLILYLAVYFCLFCCSINWLKKSLGLNFIFTAPVLWCFCEYLQNSVMTGFPWENLGYAFLSDPYMSQIAEYSGVSGLSFLLVLGNAVVYHFIRTTLRKRKGRSVLYAGVCLVLFFMIIFCLRTYGRNLKERVKVDNSNNLKVALLQANIPQYQKWDDSFKEKIIEKYKSLTRSVAQEKPDLIIWPESSLPGFFQYDEKSTYAVFSLMKELKIPILFGGNRLEVNGSEYAYYNSAYLVKPEEVKVQTYDKVHLVPYGEYIPNRDGLKKIFSSLESIVPFEDFRFGSGVKIFDIKDFKFGVSICFEDIFPDLIRLIPKSGADFILNITNDAWYMKTGAPYQHFDMAVLRAIENRTTYVRCSNTGITGYVLPDGTREYFHGKNGSPVFEEGYMIAEVPKKHSDSNTFYTEYGDVVYKVSFNISILLFLASFVYSLGKLLVRRRVNA